MLPRPAVSLTYLQHVSRSSALTVPQMFHSQGKMSTARQLFHAARPERTSGLPPGIYSNQVRNAFSCAHWCEWLYQTISLGTLPVRL